MNNKNNIREYKPMLLSGHPQPFDHPDYIFEIKFDGVRCIAYLDGKTTLTGRSGKDFTPLFPELEEMYLFCDKNCVLDGEIIVFSGDSASFTPDFARVLSRTSAGVRATKAAASAAPAVFVAFDILELSGEPLISLPLIKRKDFLDNNVREGSFIKKCPFIQGEGKKLFAFAQQNNLEGIVAKTKNGLYHPDKRTSDWLKIKPLICEELIVFGFICEENSDNLRELILGFYKDGRAQFKTQIYVGNKAAESKKLRNLRQPPMFFRHISAGFHPPYGLGRTLFV